MIMGYKIVQSNINSHWNIRLISFVVVVVVDDDDITNHSTDTIISYRVEMVVMVQYQYSLRSMYFHIQCKSIYLQRWG